MELKPEDALRLAYEKRKQILDSVNIALRSYSEGREEQIRESEREKANLNVLSFGIVGAVLGFGPSSLESGWVLYGLFVLVLNAFVLGFLAAWHQRRLNIRNYEEAVRETKEMVNPYFDAYDQFIKHEPPHEILFTIQEDAFIQYLEKQKEWGRKFHVAQRSPLSSGGWYYTIFAIGFSLVCIGLLQTYYFQDGDITGVE